MDEVWKDIGGWARDEREKREKKEEGPEGKEGGAKREGIMRRGRRGWCDSGGERVNEGV